MTGAIDESFHSLRDFQRPKHARRSRVHPTSHLAPRGGCRMAEASAAFPGDELVTLEDGRVLPRKRTICVPRGNAQVPAGPRVKLTAKLREEADTAEWLLRTAAQNGALENLRECIAQGTDVNCRAASAGATPRSTASRSAVSKAFISKLRRARSLLLGFTSYGARPQARAVHLSSFHSQERYV